MKIRVTKVVDLEAGEVLALLGAYAQKQVGVTADISTADVTLKPDGTAEIIVAEIPPAPKPSPEADVASGLKPRPLRSWTRSRRPTCRASDSGRTPRRITSDNRHSRM